jgi:hypothetical protein
MDEMFGVVCGQNTTKERLKVVMDKGMNADGNYAWIDEHARIHFITTYSTYFAQELAATPLERFEPVDTAANRRLIEQGQETGPRTGESRALYESAICISVNGCICPPSSMSSCSSKPRMAFP